MVSFGPISYGCTREVAKHERGVSVAQVLSNYNWTDAPNNHNSILLYH